MRKVVYAVVFSISLSAMPAMAQQRPSLTKPNPSAAAIPQAVPATVTPAFAMQAPVAEKKVQPATTTISAGELKVTPEMWFYEQYMKEYKDPKNAVRARAEFDTAQRQKRLATMRWYGLSNSRPRVSSDPLNVYPPAWSSNTPLQPNRWQATGGPSYYLARPEVIEVR